MTLRHAALPIGAVLLLGIGVYLFHEVRSQPAIAQVDPAVRSARRAPEPPPAPVHVGSATVPPLAAHPAQPPVVMPTAAQQIKDEPPPAPDNHEVRFTPDPSTDNPKDATKFQAIMDEANKAYDHGDFDEAKVIAQKVLAKYPTNARMLRIMVSASCIDGDTPLAQANFQKLPAADQQQMRVRCARYGVTFEGGSAAPAAP